MASSRTVLSFLLLIFIIYLISLVSIYWLYERQLHLHTQATGRATFHTQIQHNSLPTAQEPKQPTTEKDTFLQAMGDLRNQLALIEAQRETQRRRESGEDASGGLLPLPAKRQELDEGHSERLVPDIMSHAVRDGRRDEGEMEMEKKDANPEVQNVIETESVVKTGKEKGRKALVVLGHNRPELVERILLLFAQMKHIEDYFVYLSVDSLEKITHFKRLIKRPEIGKMVRGLWIMPEEFRKPTHHWHNGGLFKISEHFRFVMETAFERLGHSHLILQEDDLLPGRDFLVLFNRTQRLLDSDPNVWCISAWNDYSFRSVAREASAMLKTDFFPGLGWMLKRELWVDELKHVWPRFATTGWDHWIRLSPIRKGRVCIVPEVSRNKHVSEKGTNVRGKQVKVFKRYVSIDEFYDPNEASSPLESFDVSSLQEPAYTKHLQQLVKSAEPVSYEELIRHKDDSSDREPALDKAPLLIRYVHESFPRFKNIKLLQEPRVTYKGLIMTRYFKNGRRLLLADRREARDFLPAEERIEPHENLKKYVSNRGENCQSACHRRGLVCSEKDMYFVNNCESMQEKFKCEGGCANQQGKELPCYVVVDTLETFQQCLVATETRKRNCASKHGSTERLCACIPR